MIFQSERHRIKIFISSFFVVLITLSSCQIKKKDNPLIINMIYQDARKIILENGWKPVPGKRTDLDAKYFRPRFYYDLGYTEVTACSGTGMGYCEFLFQNQEKEYLTVTTKGGDYSPNDKHPPVVIYLGISDR